MKTQRTLSSLVAILVLTATASAEVVTRKRIPSGDLMIFHFEEPPLVRYQGGSPGFVATSPRALGEQKLDANSPASRAYLEYLATRQDQHLSKIERALFRPVEVTFRYRAATNGLALKVSRAEGKRIENLPGVIQVVPDYAEPLHTDAGPLWIGANTIWDGSGTGGSGTALGEGVIVGILDTGVNMNHPSFFATGGDGYTHTNPLGSGNFVG